MTSFRILYLWPVLLVELLVGVLRHCARWIASPTNRIHLINLLVIGASTYFLFGTIRLFMPNMPLSIRLMITVIVGVLEYMALEHVSAVLRKSDRRGSLSLDLSRVDRSFVAMSAVLAIAAALNIMGSYIDVHYRLAGDDATAEFEDHEAQDVHEALLAESYTDLRAVSDAMDQAEREYLSAQAMALRGLDQQEGTYSRSLYGVGAGAGPRYEALQRVAAAAGEQATRMEAREAPFEQAMAELQDAYAAGRDPVERDVLRQRAYDRIRSEYDGIPVPGPEFTPAFQKVLHEIHTVPRGQESQIPALEDRAVLLLSSTGLVAGPRIPERDLSSRVVVGRLSGHIRYAWRDLMRGGTEAWIAAGIALILDGSVLLLSMAWYAVFMLPYLVAIVLRDLLGISATAISRAGGTLAGRVVSLPGEMAVIGAGESREGWRNARGDWADRHEKKRPPAESVLGEVLGETDPARARRIIRVFSRARFEPKLDALSGPGFVVIDSDLDGLGQDDPLVWNALITELLVAGADPKLLALETHEGQLVHLFRPEVISAAKRMLDALDRAEQQGLGDSVKRTLERYREGLGGADYQES
jgi:hypothetical protein